MGVLDKGFSLPGVASSVGFQVSSALTKLTEAVSTTFKTIGSAGPFSKFGANTPSIESLQALATRESAAFSGIDSTEQVRLQALADRYGGSNSGTRFSGDVSASAVKSAAGSKAVSTDHLVSLSDGVDIVQFDVMPEVVENHVADYEAVTPPQSPGAFQKYKGTQSTTWVLNITLISRNSAEATANFKLLCKLRGWTAPYFGSMTGYRYPKKLGAPPPVLKLKGLRGLIGPVPVVITSLNWNWPKDVDYLPTTIPGDDGNWIPFPAVMQLPISLVESHSTTEFNQFDLEAYRNGDMKRAFNQPAVDYSNENFDSRRYSTVGGSAAPPVDMSNENYDQRLVARQELYGSSIRGVVSQGATAATLGSRLAADGKNAKEEGLRMIAEASARNAATSTANNGRPRGGS